MEDAPLILEAPSLGTPSTLITVVGLGPFTVVWDYDLSIGASFNVYVDSRKVASVAAGNLTYAITLPVLGAHTVGVTAVLAKQESLPGVLPFLSVSGLGPALTPQRLVVSDPACLPPSGAHAPAIFLTGLHLTTGKPSSRSYLSLQLDSPDPILEVAVQIDGVDEPTSLLTGTDLTAIGAVWFAMPTTGTHTLALRVLNARSNLFTQACEIHFRHLRRGSRLARRWRARAVE